MKNHHDSRHFNDNISTMRVRPLCNAVILEIEQRFTHLRESAWMSSGRGGGGGGGCGGC